MFVFVISVGLINGLLLFLLGLDGLFHSFFFFFFFLTNIILNFDMTVNLIFFLLNIKGLFSHLMNTWFSQIIHNFEMSLSLKDKEG